MNIWSALSLGVIFATIFLQFINYKVFHKDGRNSTRATLIVKEFLFAGHAIMLWEVTEIVKENCSWLFGHVFGVFFFAGLTCWFFVFLRGLYTIQR